MCTWPAKTILAASSTSGLVTRRPATFSTGMFMEAQTASSSAPPPCTTTTLMEKDQSRAICSQRALRILGSAMTSPPTFTTKVLPRNSRTYWEASLRAA